MRSINLFTLCVFVSLAIMVGGCPYERTVTIITIPSGADVIATSNQGLKYFPEGQTPLNYTFRFGQNPSEGPSSYNMDVELAGYESAEVAVAGTDFEQKEIYIELKPEVVREVKRLEPVISEGSGYTIEPRTVRAWVEDIEREGMAASSIIRLGDFQSVLGMAISNDGQTLVFSLGEVVKDEKGKEKRTANLRSVSTKGGGITEITSGQWLDISPSFSADGFLHFSSDRLRKQRRDLFRIYSERTSGIAVIRQTSEGYNYQPSVSNTGVLAFTYKPSYRGNLSSSSQIWTLGGENQYPTQLREGAMPAMSPDGTQIAFIAPDRQLWRIPINGQNPVQLTNTISPKGKRHPAWSPDGQYILYASDEGKDSKDEPNYDIWMIGQDGTSPLQLTTNGSVDDFPVVSPDQKHIYFCSNRGFKEGIWRIPFPVLK